MFKNYHQQMWRDAQTDLKKCLVFDGKLKKSYRDYEAAKWLIGHLYINYIQILNKLDTCYDQMVHPQKREVIGRLLDMTLGRILELKDEMVRIDCDDYCFLDNILMELKLTHQDLEIPVPKYYLREREKEREYRKGLIQKVFEAAEQKREKEEYLKDFKDEEKEEAWEKYLLRTEQKKFMAEKANDASEHKVKTRKKTEEPPTKAEIEAIRSAILLIQRHERARQGRVKALLQKKKIDQKAVEIKVEKELEDMINKAATVIQQHWRRHRWRKKRKQKEIKLLNILGMTQPSFKDMTLVKKLNKIAAHRRKIQEKNQKEYEEALVAIKDKVTASYTIPMEEDTVDEIFGWIQNFYEKTLCLPDYPPAKPIIPDGKIMGVPKGISKKFIELNFSQEESLESLSPGKKSVETALAVSLAGKHAIGGSALVTAGHWITPEEFLICQKELQRLMKNKDKTENEVRKTSGGNKKKEDFGFELQESNFLVPLRKADCDFRSTWLDLDESNNYEQKYIREFVKNDKCFELSMEVRKVVDEMMELELEIFKDALYKDEHPKKKRKKKKQKKKKQVKKKKKEIPDLTENRTLDELFLELFENGIIKNYEEARLNEFFGERSFHAYEYRRKEEDCFPDVGDVKELLLQLCILPLGSWRIHQLHSLIKSVCILGSENSGKEFLARIICTEVGAVMFDLTPSNLVGKYPGKDGLKMLQHLIEKMSRALQPSILFVDGAEKMFYKKVPKEEKDEDPKRLAKLIQKIVKHIKPTEQILLLGTSSKPWLAKKKPFMKTYQKFILVPQMEYGSYMRLWAHLLGKYHSMPREFDIYCLAKVSDGYSVKAIQEAIKNVMTVKRIARHHIEPYKPAEFLNELLKFKPGDEKLKDKCYQFFSKTDLPKRKVKRLLEIKKERENAKRMGL